MIGQIQQSHGNKISLQSDCEYSDVYGKRGQNSDEAQLKVKE